MDPSSRPLYTTPQMAPPPLMIPVHVQQNQYQNHQPESEDMVDRIPKKRKRKNSPCAASLLEHNETTNQIQMKSTSVPFM